MREGREEIKVKLPRIEEILEGIGVYRVPKVQRDFVWSKEKVREFFASLYKQHPVGVIVIWKTNDYIPSDPIIDDITNDESSEYSYILDGNQRITSLLLAKRGWEISRGGRKICIEGLHYDPMNDKFVFDTRKIDLYWILNNQDNKIREWFAGRREESEEELEKRWRSVRDKILEYQIPVYEIKKGVRDYKEIAEIFNKINSTGVKVGDLDMVLSFFASEFSEAKDAVIRISDRFGEIDLKVIIRLIFCNFGVDQRTLTKQGAETVLNKIKREWGPNAINRIISESEKAINIGVRLLEELGIYNRRFLPSQLLLIPVLKWIWVLINRRVDNAENIVRSCKNDIAKWLIIGSIRGRYTGGSVGKRLQEDLKVIEKFNQRRNEKRFPIDSLLKNTLTKKRAQKLLTKDEISHLEENSARKKSFLMLLAILLVKNEAGDWSERGRSVAERIKNNEIAIHHIFSERSLENADVDFEPVDVQHFANITLIDPKVNKRIKDEPPSSYISGLNIEDEELEKHFIPLERDLWEPENFGEFIQKRRDLIFRKMSELEIMR